MKKFIKSKSFILLLIVIMATITITFSGVSLARFINKKNDVNVVTPINYVLTVDKNENETYVIQSDSNIEFNIFNYDELLTSEVDLELSYQLFEKDNISNVLKTEEFTLTKNTQNVKNVSLSGLTLLVGKTYQLDVKMSKPYTKTYTFYYYVVSPTIPTYYNLVDNGNWLQLDIYIGNNYESDTVKINILETLAPNNLNEYMEDWTSNSIVTLNVTSNSHYTLEFFELESHVYTNVENKEFNKDYTISFN